MPRPSPAARVLLSLALTLATSACTPRRADLDPAAEQEPGVAREAVPPATPAAPARPFDFATAPADWNPSGIAWRTLEAGLAEAQASGKPILMVMHAEWCGHCRNYSRVFHDQELATLARRFVMISVDTDRDPAANQRYAADGTYLPRTYVLDSSGRHLAHLDAGRARYRYFFDEQRPGPTVAVMRRALE